jgi:hypothetical protein
VESPLPYLPPTPKLLIAQQGQQRHLPTAHDKAAPLALYHFARFIKEVSDSAEKQTRKVVNLTYALFWLTTVLLIVALIQIAIMWPQNSEEIDAHDNKAPNNQNN